jgi:hypothetical protein
MICSKNIWRKNAKNTEDVFWLTFSASRNHIVVRTTPDFPRESTLATNNLLNNDTQDNIFLLMKLGFTSQNYTTWAAYDPH